MQLDIAIEDWPPGDWEGLCERAVKALEPLEPALANARLQVSIVFTDDARLHALNRHWRARDRATNVLSFPMLTRDDVLGLERDGAPDMPPVALGDIALAHETCAREAGEKGIALCDHAAHLIVHGLLHLAGHDHEISTEDAERMERIEVAALAKMAIANPYIDDRLDQGAQTE